jgi:hypothetical protein
LRILSLPHYLLGFASMLALLVVGFVAAAMILG